MSLKRLSRHTGHFQHIAMSDLPPRLDGMSIEEATISNMWEIRMNLEQNSDCSEAEVHNLPKKERDHHAVHTTDSAIHNCSLSAGLWTGRSVDALCLSRRTIRGHRFGQADWERIG